MNPCPIYQNGMWSNTGSMYEFNSGIPGMILLTIAIILIGIVSFQPVIIGLGILVGVSWQEQQVWKEISFIRKNTVYIWGKDGNAHMESHAETGLCKECKKPFERMDWYHCPKRGKHGFTFVCTKCSNFSFKKGDIMTKEQALKKIEELKKFVEGEEKQGRFMPKVGEDYYYINSNSRWDIITDTYTNEYFDKSRYTMGNVFKTKEQAELHKLRLESMANKWLPENEKEYFCYDFADDSDIEPYRDYFDVTALSDIANYHMGNCHRTKEDAMAWGKKYSKAFEIKKMSKIVEAKSSEIDGKKLAEVLLMVAVNNGEILDDMKERFGDTTWNEEKDRFYDENDKEWLQLGQFFNELEGRNNEKIQSKTSDRKSK